MKSASVPARRGDCFRLVFRVKKVGLSLSGDWLRKVCSSECAVVFYGGRIVSGCGLKLGSEVAQVGSRFVDRYVSLPAFVLRQIDALVLGAFAFELGEVSAVLMLRADAKISTPIVERDSINMIHWNAVGGSNNEAVKLDAFPADASRD